MAWPSRFSALPSALLALSTCIASTAVADTYLQSNNTVPAPYSFPANGSWSGIEGNWSVMTLRVGTPAQYVRVLPSWQSYQTWVVIPQGCFGATNQSACDENRGGLFNYNDSSTWENIGLYGLGIEENLGYTGNAYYAYDQVALADNGPSLKNTTVAGMAGSDFYLGRFGVNPKPTNFTDLENNSPSYMTQLKQQSMIPSVSFGYTAGAYYRDDGVDGSLTLGGYDSSKFAANNVTFNFGSDSDYQTIVALQQILTESTVASSPNQVELLPQPIYIEIDTTLAQIWLPMAACLAFEEEFGLQWNDESELYLINDTTHADLVARNANISFHIAQLTTGSQTVTITLPYAAFDHVAKAGFKGLSADSRYFPLQRGQNSTQYVLGRVFMQEAYITVDYEVSRFQLAQTTWNADVVEHIVAIPAANSSSQDPNAWTASTYSPSYTVSASTSTSTSSGGLSTGAIVGIVVGVVVGLLIIALIAFFVIRRRRQRKAKQLTDSTLSSSDTAYNKDNKDPDLDQNAVFPKAELAGSEPPPFGLTHHDMDRKALLSPHYPPSSAGTGTPYSPSSGSGGGFNSYTPGGEGTMSSQQSSNWPLTPVSEAHSRAIYEMPGDMPESLKDGRELSEKEALQHRERIYKGIDETAAAESPLSSEVAVHDDDDAAAREPRRIAAEDVVNAKTGDSFGRHRAFSFEFDSSGSDGSPGAATSDSATLVQAHHDAMVQARRREEEAAVASEDEHGEGERQNLI